MSIRILLADDHKIMQYGLNEAIKSEKDMEIVAAAEDGTQVVELARKLSPDVVVMDITMPNMNGIEATRLIVRDFPDIKVLGLSMHSAVKIISEMFRAGCKGFVLKDCEYSELVSAIRLVLNNEIYLTPSLGEETIEVITKGLHLDDATLFAVLSGRERQVAQLFAEGKTTRQVAAVLCISPKTVEGHRSKIFNKLNIDNIADLTRYAIREGLTSSDI
ncbi:MAG: response regulator [Sedimentisphaeraceae bacterium JB056]